jgi:hypothetical protein
VLYSELSLTHADKSAGIDACRNTLVADLAIRRRQEVKVRSIAKTLADYVNHQEWDPIIYGLAAQQFLPPGDKLFTPVWRQLRFINCPLSYSQALKVYNSYFQDFASRRQKGCRNSGMASNQ